MSFKLHNAPKNHSSTNSFQCPFNLQMTKTPVSKCGAKRTHSRAVKLCSHPLARTWVHDFMQKGQSYDGYPIKSSTMQVNMVNLQFQKYLPR